MTSRTASVRTAMEQQDPVPSRPAGSGFAADDKPKGDPWHAFGYLVSGVLFYGFLGWLADQWLETRFFIVAGIFLGAGLGIYLTFGRFGQKQPPAPSHGADDHSRAPDNGPQDPKQEQN